MRRQLDRSKWIAELIQGLSTRLSRQGGLLPLIGVLLVILSFVLQVVDVFAINRWVELVGVVLLNLGIIVALIGLLLREALGS